MYDYDLDDGALQVCYPDFLFSTTYTASFDTPRRPPVMDYFETRRA